MGEGLEIAGAVFNGVPVNETCKTSIIDKVSSILIASLIIGDNTTGDKLIITLTEG